MQQHLHILLVDDDAVDRMVVTRALRAAGISATVTEAVDYASTFEALANDDFNVMLLDYRLPGTDGLSVLRDMRDSGFMTPVIMLTGQGDEQLAVEMLRSGATDYLTKNAVSPDVLSQSINRALRIHRAEQSAAVAENMLRELAERQRFLAEASQLLVESLDQSVILTRLVEMGSRQIGDGCAVDMLLDEGRVNRVAVGAREVGSGVERFLRSFDPSKFDRSIAPAGAIDAGHPLILSTSLQDVAQNPALALFADAGIRSIMIVPLVVRGRSMGAITFVCASPGKTFGDDDLLLAEDFAHRAAVALDNARLYREAQDAVSVRDAFLSVAAHELKTPLTTLYGNVQLIQRRAQREGSMSERDQRTLRIVFEQTTRLNRMIGALLDLSRLQMGQFTIEPAPVDLAELAKRVVDELQPSLDRHSVVLRGVDSPLLVMGDELRLEQVLQNLIQNGVKYSPAGGEVVVEVSHDQEMVQILVRDSGIGIPKSSIPNLFRRFFRAENVREHRISGIGVGLYVVNEIITRHGGQVSVESTEGEGTTFIVQLPLPDAVNEAVAA